MRCRHAPISALLHDEPRMSEPCISPGLLDLLDGVAELRQRTHHSRIEALLDLKPGFLSRPADKPPARCRDRVCRFGLEDHMASEDLCRDLARSLAAGAAMAEDAPIPELR